MVAPPCMSPPARCLLFLPPFLLRADELKTLASLRTAAGTHSSPIWPRLPGLETFTGKQIHSSQYRCAEDFRGARVAVVGAGNSGAQILAEVSQPGVASSTLWSTKEEPSFLPNDLSGKEIFDTGTNAVLFLSICRNRYEHAAFEDATF